MYLDYAETQAEQHHPLYMKDWKEKLNAFLQFNEKEVLGNPGSVSHEVAQQLALDEYKKFNIKRLREEASLPDKDFEEAVKMIKGENRNKKK